MKPFTVLFLILLLLSLAPVSLSLAAEDGRRPASEGAGDKGKESEPAPGQPAAPVEPAEEKWGKQPVFPEDVIRSWGYVTEGTAVNPQEIWEIGFFGKARVRTQYLHLLEKAAAKAPANDDQPDLLLSEEIYATPEQAANRIARLHEIPPDADPSLKVPARDTRDGVAVGKTAYVLFRVDDAVKLVGVMKQLKAHLEKR